MWLDLRRGNPQQQSILVAYVMHAVLERTIELKTVARMDLDALTANGEVDLAFEHKAGLLPWWKGRHRLD